MFKKSEDIKGRSLLEQGDTTNSKSLAGGTTKWSDVAKLSTPKIKFKNPNVDLSGTNQVKATNPMSPKKPLPNPLKSPEGNPSSQHKVERPVIQRADQNNLTVDIKTAKPVRDDRARQRASRDNLAPGKKRMTPQQVAPRIKPTVGSINYIKQLSAALDSGTMSDDIREKINNLGNVSESKLSYFDSTRASKACAKEFFGLLVTRKEIMTAIQEGVKGRQDHLNQDDVWPGCISFVTAKLNGISVCFVALSRAADKSDTLLLEYIDELAVDLNRGQKARQDEFYYAVVKETSTGFKNTIRAITNNTRTCAEYDFGALLSKIFVECGTSLQVEGCTNAFLFDYAKETEVSYGKTSGGKTIIKTKVLDTYDPSVKKRSDNTELTIKGGKKLTIIPCCQVCQSNKNAFLSTLISSQEEGEQFRRIQQERDTMIKKKSKRLSTGIEGYQGASMIGFLGNVCKIPTLLLEEKIESKTITVS